MRARVLLVSAAVAALLIFVSSALATTIHVHGLHYNLRLALPTGYRLEQNDPGTDSFKITSHELSDGTNNSILGIVGLVQEPPQKLLEGPDSRDIREVAGGVYCARADAYEVACARDFDHGDILLDFEGSDSNAFGIKLMTQILRSVSGTLMGLQTAAR